MRGASQITAVGAPRSDWNRLAQSIVDNDFHYSLEYDYQESRNCSQAGCYEDGICRCSTIDSIEIEEVPSSMELVFNVIGPQAYILRGKPALEKVRVAYALERALGRAELDTADFYAGTQAGYYGQEIGKVTIDSSEAKQKIKDTLRNVSFAANKNTVNQLLKNEYGYLLPRLKNKDYQLEQIEISKLDFPQKNHLASLDPQAIERYKIDTGDSFSGWRAKVPRGVVEKDGNVYKVIDGYHRLTAAVMSGKRKVWVWTAK
jgi:hypothetical protein